MIYVNRFLLYWLMTAVTLTNSFAADNAKQVLSPLARVMGQGGAEQCQGRVHQVADFLTKDVNSGATLLMPPDHVNDHLISASIEVFDGSVLFYANLDFAPMATYGCDASFETVTYWPTSCEKVAKTQFMEAKNSGKMRQHIIALTHGDNLQIFLMPAGDGCVSIKKQIIFDRF